MYSIITAIYWLVTVNSLYSFTWSNRGEKLKMYTTNEQGILNTYAGEPAIYYAEYPSPEQRQRYAIQAAVAFVFVTLTLLTAVAVS